jgi:hypothetical protein
MRSKSFNNQINFISLLIILSLLLIIQITPSSQFELEKKILNTNTNTTNYRTGTGTSVEKSSSTLGTSAGTSSTTKDFEPTLIMSDSKHQRNIDEVNLNNNI